jgi:hypothetical protein
MSTPPDQQEIGIWSERLFKTIAAIFVVAVVLGVAFIIFVLLAKAGIWIWNL